MRMRLRVLAGVIGLLTLPSCSTEPEFGLFTRQPGGIGDLPGRLCILIANNQDRWRLELMNAELRTGASCTVRADTRSGSSPIQTRVELLLPKRVGIEYRGPWALSADNKWLAASVAPSGDTRFIEDQFVIVDTLTKDIVARIEGESGEFVTAMAWSPDSSLLAVIFGHEQKGRCGSGILSSIAGHPVRCVNFTLGVFNVEGSTLGKVEFARKIPGGGANINWLR